jgi:S-(hydroxymethyl)glutathione dehydrogenase / alcohol dehydrogenase
MMQFREIPNTTRAAVLIDTGKPLVLMELELPQLSSGQALVKMAYAGVCHTQLNEVRGLKGEDRFLPHTLGHEGSGQVVVVGSNTTKVKVGDNVVLTWIKGKGAEVSANSYRAKGFDKINSGAISTFMDYTVVCENRLCVIPPSMPLREAALLGCALPTGGGIVLNTGVVKEKSSVAVFGCGGVGSCAIAVAAMCGANPLIAIDRVASKLDIARALGATHVIDASKEDVGARIQAIAPGGVNLAIEATGVVKVMEMAHGVVKTGGGLCVLAGNVPHGQKITIDPFDLIRGREIAGSWGGSTDPDRDIPRYVDMILKGNINLEKLMTGYRLDEINQALDDLEGGRVLRPIISFEEA